MPIPRNVRSSSSPTPPPPFFSARPRGDDGAVGSNFPNKFSGPNTRCCPQRSQGGGGRKIGGTRLPGTVRGIQARFKKAGFPGFWGSPPFDIDGSNHEHWL